MIDRKTLKTYRNMAFLGATRLSEAKRVVNLLVDEIELIQERVALLETSSAASTLLAQLTEAPIPPEVLAEIERLEKEYDGMTLIPTELLLDFLNEIPSDDSKEQALVDWITDNLEPFEKFIPQHGIVYVNEGVTVPPLKIRLLTNNGWGWGTSFSYDVRPKAKWALLPEWLTK
jgi:hypothetical protein